MALRRSREGAWIEMLLRVRRPVLSCVAPVRERGLKCQTSHLAVKELLVAPVRERGLKLLGIALSAIIRKVAPVRERGLKFEVHRHL